MSATDADPVGVHEIAERLGVTRFAVYRWRERHDDFPDPRWVVHGGPAWDWPDVARWAISTGRLTP